VLLAHQTVEAGHDVLRKLSADIVSFLLSVGAVWPSLCHPPACPCRPTAQRGRCRRWNPGVGLGDGRGRERRKLYDHSLAVHWPVARDRTPGAEVLERMWAFPCAKHARAPDVYSDVRNLTLAKMDPTFCGREGSSPLGTSPLLPIPRNKDRRKQRPMDRASALTRLKPIRSIQP
jgi:hypothetical protein